MPQKESEEKKEQKTEEKKVNEKYDSVKDIEENKAITFLSYLGILALVPLLVKRDSQFAQFHAKQGIVLAVAWFAAAWIANVIPFIGILIISPIVMIGGIALMIIGLVNVGKGETKKLPIIGDIADKFNI